MDFTFDLVISAINATQQHQDQQSMQNALVYLEQWTHSENGIVLAMQILSDNNLTDIHKIYAASLIKTQIPIFWGKIQSDIRVNLRTQFFDFFNSCTLPNDNLLLNMIIDIIVIVALFEFPQEWPDLSNIILSDLSGMEDAIKQFHYYHLIGQLIYSVDKCQFITPNRVQYLRNLFLDSGPVLSSHINACFSNEYLVPDGLKIFNGFLLWASFDQVMPMIDSFHKVCFQFIYNESTKKESLECLTTLFSTRLDSTAFVTLAPLIITSLCNPQSKFPNGKHATSDSEVLNFLLRILAHYLTILLTVYDLSNVTPKIEMIRARMNEAQVSPEDLSNSLLNIIKIIISVRNPELLTEEYWTFWITVFYNMLGEQKMNRPFKPTYDFLKGLIPEIRQAIYECVPLDSLEDNNGNELGVGQNTKGTAEGPIPQTSVFCTNRSRNAWSSLALIDPEGTVNFLKEQSPSESLCYAIGNLEFCCRNQFDVSLLSSELNELYNSAQSNDASPQFYVALLFCFSHTLSFDNGPQAFTNFIKFATKCVNEEDPPISTAATNALYYASRRNRAGFMNEQYISDICDYCEIYLKRLPFDDAVRMYKIASSLVCRMSTKEQATNMYQKMTTPLLQAMEALFELDKIFECIKEACYSSEDFSPFFMEFLWPKLLELTNQIIHDVTAPQPILEGVLDTDSAAISKEAYNEERIFLILSWMVERAQANIQNHRQIDDSFYKFIAVVRSQHNELNIKLPDIINMFIVPAFQNDMADMPFKLPGMASIMLMLSEFHFEIFDFPWFVPLSIEAIQSYNRDDNINAIDCISKLIYRLTNAEKFADAIQKNIIPSILTAVFRSLTDTMHKDAIQKFVQFIKMLMSQASKFNLINNNLFTQMFLNAIQESVGQEQAPGMFLDFITKLKNTIDQAYHYTKIISDFLILIRKISPNDKDAFKITEKSNNLDSNRGRIIKIENGQTQEITLNDQKHFRIIKRPTTKPGF